MTVSLVRPPKPPLPPADVVDSDTTICLCGGLLAYVRLIWHHIDRCIECVGTTEPCAERHFGCYDARPEPVTCIHDVDWRCTGPVNLLVPCAYARAPRSCCGCCWLEPEVIEESK